jgi:hypothetical protein
MFVKIYAMTVGNVRRTALLTLTLASCITPLLACADQTSTQPSRTILPVTGTWTGTYRVTSCTPPPYFGSCSLFTTQTYPIRLTLSQKSLAVSGTFDGVVANGSTVSVPVSGAVDMSGTLSLQGNQPFQDVYSGAHWVGQPGVSIDGWTTTMSSGTSLAGTFVETVQAHYFLTVYPATITFQSDIVTLTLESSSAVASRRVS